MTEQITKKTTPYAVASLVLGILSIVLGCFMVGLVLGIIGLILGNKARNTYNANPSLYTGAGAFNAGRITSIIGIIFGALYLVYYIIVVAVIGTTGFSIWNILSDLG